MQLKAGNRASKKNKLLLSFSHKYSEQEDCYGKFHNQVDNQNKFMLNVHIHMTIADNSLQL